MLKQLHLTSIDTMAFNALRVLIIAIAAYIAMKIAQRFINGLREYAIRMMQKHGDGATVELEKRAATIAGTVRKVAAVMIWALALLTSMKELNFDVRPLLAGAGVAGIALGLGAQSLIKDVIGGLFLLIDNQLRINDVAILNGTGGVVEEMNLRTTVLRGDNGAVHIFPNGSIQSMSNLTRGYSYYMFEIGIDYSADTDRALAAMKAAAEELRAEDAYGPMILEPLDVFGVDKISGSAVILKARIKTQPIKQWTVGREMNRRIKKRFEQQGIAMPNSIQAVHIDNLPPATIGPEDVRRIVREVLNERESGGSGASKDKLV
jgi:small conductance mechanosensitive channel